MPINTGARIVPKTAEIDISSRSGPYGTHDTLRNGFYSAAHQLAPKHALQQSLASIEQVEMDRKMFIATSTLGYHIPLRINLEKDIAKSNGVLGGLKSKRLTGSIVSGTDEDIEISDIFAVNPTVRSNKILDPQDLIEF